MTTHNDQLFQLLSEFQTWQDGDALSEQRLVQHDLVLAHLARLYGGLSWNAQHFGLLPSYSLTVEIQEEGPVALSHLLAVTATGKLLVCASAPLPDNDNPSENNGLFAIARPLELPETLQKTWPDFPLYQVELAWRAWEAGIDDIVNTGEGLPIGRLKAGQWDADYIPPMMSLVTDERLRLQAVSVMNQLSSVASRDSRVAEQVLALRQSDLSDLTPLAFWHAHCRCLVALKDHPKLADDADYRDKVASLVSSSESKLWEKEESLLPLGSIWKYIEKRLAKESEREKGMARLMKRVDKLASCDNQVADFVLALQQADWRNETPLLFWQAHCRCLVALKDHPKLVDDAKYQDSVSKLLSETFSPLVIGDGLEPLRLAWQRVEDGLKKKEKPAPKPERSVSWNWYATSMVGMMLLVILLGVGLVYQHEKSSNEMKAAFEKQLAALNKKQAERADKLSEQLTKVDKNLKTDLTAQIENVAKTHSKELASQSRQFKTEITGLTNAYNEGLTKLKTQSTQGDTANAGQIAALETKHAQTAQALRIEITALDNEHDKKVDDLSKELTKVDNKHLQKTGKLSEQLSEVDKRIGKVFRDTLKDGTLGPEMVVIPAGTFRMGDIQGGGSSDEKPVHEVSIKSFAMGRYEVTFAEYDKFVEATARKKPKDEGWGRGNRPVIKVSWEDVTAYAEWLSTQTGQQYRLPTETEWEYAARAGTETKYWWGNTASHEYANYGIEKCCGGLAKGKDRWEYISPVGSFAANPFGLYDTAGNVWEWTCSEYESAYKGKEKYCLSKEDSTKDSLFVLRGGSWIFDAWRMRSSFRFWGLRTIRNGFYGVRLARTL